MTKERRILLLVEANAREAYLETLGIEPDTYFETKEMEEIKYSVIEAIQMCDVEKLIEAASTIMYWGECVLSENILDDILSLKLKAIRIALRCDDVKALVAVDYLLRNGKSKYESCQDNDGYTFEACNKRNSKEYKSLEEIEESLNKFGIMLDPAI